MEIPGYIIGEEIGSGGMASVYRAVQSSLNRPVALKIMREKLALTADYSRRFLREAKAVAQLQHRHIVSIYQVGVSDERHFYSMQLLQGGDLANKIEEGIDWPTLRFVMIGICQALQYSHDRGFVHRDVKPGNILFDEEGHPYLTDFGLVRDLNTTSALTAAGLSLGTSLYMSPEQITGKSVSHSCDLYGLGVTTFEGLLGRTPFKGDTSLAIAYQHVNEPVPTLEGVDPAWQEFFATALAKSPSDRFQSASEMAAALRKLPDEAPTLPDVPEDKDNSFELPPPPARVTSDQVAVKTSAKVPVESPDVPEDEATKMMPAITPAPDVVCEPEAGVPSIDDDTSEDDTLLASPAVDNTSLDDDVPDPTQVMPALTPAEGVEAVPEQRITTKQRPAVPDLPPEEVDPAETQSAQEHVQQATVAITAPPPPNSSSEPVPPSKLATIGGRLAELPKEQKLIWGGGLAALLALVVIGLLVSGSDDPAATTNTVVEQTPVEEPAPQVAETTTAPPPEAVNDQQNLAVATVDITSGEAITVPDPDGDTSASPTDGQLDNEDETGSLAEPAEDGEVTVLTDSEQVQLIAEANAHIGRDELMSGRDGNAFAKLSRVLQADPTNALALAGLERIVARYLQLAETQQAEGDFDTAKLYLDRAKLAGPDNAEVAARLDEFDEVRSRSGVQALLRQGNDHLAQGRTEQAKAAFREVLVLQPGNMSALDGLSRASRSGAPRLVTVSDALASGGRGPTLAIFQPGSYPIQWRPGGNATITTDGFAMATRETSVALFKKFADATGYKPGGRGGNNCKVGPGRSRARGSWTDPGYSQTPDHPVSCVDWDAANRFAGWLSSQTGRSYRLPTEAEWLIANSALLGVDLSPAAVCAQGDVGDRTYAAQQGRFKSFPCGDGQAAPGNRLFQPTSVGIYSLIGGVSEWTADCWTSRLSQAPASTAPPSNRNCGRRLIRGISWRSGVAHDPLHYRVNEKVAEARDFIGFRVVRAR